MDIIFYKKMIQVYEERNASDKTWNELYEIMYREIYKVKAEELVPEHLELYKLAETYFASIDDFEKANAIKTLQEGAQMVFKARERIEEIKRININKNPN